MRRYRILTFALLNLFLVTLASLAPQAAEAQTPALAPGTVRVWFLRSAGSLNVSHDGMVTANAVAVGIDSVKPPE